MKKLSMWLPTAVTLAACGCDLSSVDPGGGWVSGTTVSLRAAKSAASDGSGDNQAGQNGPVVSGEPGNFSGRVVLTGPAPVLAPLVGKGASKVDPTVCAREAAIPDESLVVGADGAVANVFIYMDRLPTNLKDKAFELSASAPLLDQKICIFKPHALIVRVGQKLEMKNSDAVLHNVKTSPARNQPANESMPPGAALAMEFKKSETAPFISECAIHPWMRFWTLVSDHPYAAVTDAEGRFNIPDLPPGEYTFKVWHERAPGNLLERKLTVTIKPGETHNQELKYDASAFGAAG